MHYKVDEQKWRVLVHKNEMASPNPPPTWVSPRILSLESLFNQFDQLGELNKSIWTSQARVYVMDQERGLYVDWNSSWYRKYMGESRWETIRYLRTILESTEYHVHNFTGPKMKQTLDKKLDGCFIPGIQKLRVDIYGEEELSSNDLLDIQQQAINIRNEISAANKIPKITETNSHPNQHSDSVWFVRGSSPIKHINNETSSHALLKFSSEQNQEEKEEKGESKEDVGAINEDGTPREVDDYSNSNKSKIDIFQHSFSAKRHLNESNESEHILPVKSKKTRATRRSRSSKLKSGKRSVSNIGNVLSPYDGTR